MRRITKKTAGRLGLPVVLLGIMICIYVLIGQTPDLDRAYLIQAGTASRRPLELQPGETREQGFFAYKAFDHVTLFRKNTGAENLLGVEALLDGQPLFSEEVVFAPEETEQDLRIPGEKGTVILRLTNLGDTSIQLPLLSSSQYFIGDWQGDAESKLQFEVYRASGTAKWCYEIAALMLLALSLFVLWGGGKKFGPGKATCMILVLCLVYLLLFPAWNINDFGKHFATAYAFTSRLLGIETEEPDDLIVREDDLLFFEYVLQDRDLAPYQPSWRSYDDAWGYLFQRTESNRRVPMEGITGVHREYGIWSYLPHVLGILIARLLSLNLVTAIFLARLCGVGCYAAVIYLALRKLPKGMQIPVTILTCVPVNLMNLTAISYDAPCYAAVLYLFACIFSLRKRYQRRDAVGLVICSLAICLVKRGAYAPVLLSMLLLLRGRDRKRIRLVALCAAAGTLGLAMIYRGIIFGDSGLQAYQSECRGTYDMQWAGTHPLDYFIIMIRTFLRQPDMAFGVIGKYLAWNSAVVPDAVCGLFYLLIGISIFTREQEDDPVRPLKGWERFWVWAPLVLMTLLIPASILNYTHWGRDSIEGLQGRYFLPLLIPLLMMSFHNLRGKVSLKRLDSTVLLWGTEALHLLSVYYLWLTFLRGA